MTRRRLAAFLPLFLFVGSWRCPLEAGGQPPLVRVAVLLDKTLSMKSGGTVAPSTEDFEPLLAHLGQAGGEVGVGLIDEDFNVPLLRVRASKRRLRPRPSRREPTSSIVPSK